MAHAVTRLYRKTRYMLQFLDELSATTADWYNGSQADLYLAIISAIENVVSRDLHALSNRPSFWYASRSRFLVSL